MSYRSTDETFAFGAQPRLSAESRSSTELELCVCVCVVYIEEKGGCAPVKQVCVLAAPTTAPPAHSSLK